MKPRTKPMPPCWTRRAAMALAIFVAVAAPARGQLGVLPEKSPFRDMEYNQEWTVLSGWMSAGADAAGVAPGGGPMLGARYDYHFTGPLFGYVRAPWASSASERRSTRVRRSRSERSGPFSGPSCLPTLGSRRV